MGKTQEGRILTCRRAARPEPIGYRTCGGRPKPTVVLIVGILPTGKPLITLSRSPLAAGMIAGTSCRFAMIAISVGRVRLWNLGGSTSMQNHGRSRAVRSISLNGKRSARPWTVRSWSRPRLDGGKYAHQRSYIRNQGSSRRPLENILWLDERTESRLLEWRSTEI